MLIKYTEHYRQPILSREIFQVSKLLEIVHGKDNDEENEEENEIEENNIEQNSFHCIYHISLFYFSLYISKIIR